MNLVNFRNSRQHISDHFQFNVSAAEYGRVFIVKSLEVLYSIVSIVSRDNLYIDVFCSIVLMK